MPLTPKGRRAKKSIVKAKGPKNGTRLFHALVNSGRIPGAKKKPAKKP